MEALLTHHKERAMPPGRTARISRTAEQSRRLRRRLRRRIQQPSSRPELSLRHRPLLPLLSPLQSA